MNVCVHIVFIFMFYRLIMYVNRFDKRMIILKYYEYECVCTYCVHIHVLPVNYLCKWIRLTYDNIKKEEMQAYLVIVLIFDIIIIF